MAIPAAMARKYLDEGQLALIHSSWVPDPLEVLGRYDANATPAVVADSVVIVALANSNLPNCIFLVLVLLATDTDVSVHVEQWQSGTTATLQTYIRIEQQELPDRDAGEQRNHNLGFGEGRGI